MTAQDPLSGLTRFRDVTSHRASSWDRSGGNTDWCLIPAGRTVTLLDEPGPGCIRHIYWTYIDRSGEGLANLFRGLVLRAYWDGCTVPAIETPLGDFFGVTNGQVCPIRGLAFCTNPGFTGTEAASWGFNCYLPMPFADGARVEIENQGDVESRIWYHLDYEKACTEESVPPGRLHASWNRENPTQATSGPEEGERKNLNGAENYVVLDTSGDGHFVGYFLTVVNLIGGWWGEGDDMIFIDGERFPPSLHGTGTEEIFGGGACPATPYTGPYTGFHCVENRLGSRYLGNNGMYRFLLTDPIRFRRSIRVTLEHGHGNDTANDYASVAFCYLNGCMEARPPLPPIDLRLPNPSPTATPTP